MDVSQVTNPIQQQLQQLIISALNPQVSTSTSNPQVLDATTRGVQGHHHHHHKSMTDMISKMESTIDDAVKAGKLSNDQAAQIKKELDSITETLKQGQSSSGAQGTQLTSDDLQKIKTEFQDVRKQLFDALNPQGSASASNGIDNLFKQMDANGNGVVDQNEFSTFINSLV